MMLKLANFGKLIGRKWKFWKEIITDSQGGKEYPTYHRRRNTKWIFHTLRRTAF